MSPPPIPLNSGDENTLLFDVIEQSHVSNIGVGLGFYLAATLTLIARRVYDSGDP